MSPDGQEREAIEEITFEAIRGPEGVCLAIGVGRSLTRIAGPKPWGGGTTINQWKVKLADLLDELPGAALAASMEEEATNIARDILSRLRRAREDTERPDETRIEQVRASDIRLGDRIPWVSGFEEVTRFEKVEQVPQGCHYTYALGHDPFSGGTWLPDDPVLRGVRDTEQEHER